MKLLIEKIDLLYSVKSKNNWSFSHSQCPVVAKLDVDNYRIFYSTRDQSNISRPSFFDLNMYSGQVSNMDHKYPLLDIGKPGFFDDSGVMPTDIIFHNNEWYLFYIGWTVRDKTPYHNSIGIAKSNDCLNFKKLFSGPIISTTNSEPLFNGTIGVFKKDNVFYGYYLSCIDWIIHDNKFEPVYDIKIATSLNLIDWKRDNRIAIGLNEDEGGIVSARVISVDGKFIMLYSYRKKIDYRYNPSNSYKIGFAESNDLLTWKRIDHVIYKQNLNNKNLNYPNDNNNWDVKMQCYPYIFEYLSEYYMLYNGNGFGISGIGLAKISFT